MEETNDNFMNNQPATGFWTIRLQTKTSLSEKSLELGSKSSLKDINNQPNKLGDTKTCCSYNPVLKIFRISSIFDYKHEL